MSLSVIRSAASRLLDAVYPSACVCCRSNGSWWCAPCRAAVARLSLDPCRRCLALFADHGQSGCEGCLPFAGIVATGYYHSLPLRRLIAELKYQGVTATGSELEAYLHKVASARDIQWPWEREASLLIQPMPLAPARERDRGFNQAAWIAERMRSAWQIGGEAVNALMRNPRSVAQAELGHDERLRAANVRSAFFATRRLLRPVLLVDDVVTTGSTAAEAARVLMAVGAPRVYLATLALGK